MKPLYALTLLVAIFILPACSKDVLKSYDKRIIGTWKIIDVDRFGFSAADALPFAEDDLFTFAEDGALTCVLSNKNYKGSWDIERRNENEEQLKKLHIVAVDFTSEEVRTENFTNMQFTGTNRFVTHLNYGTRTYTYRFLRQ